MCGSSRDCDRGGKFGKRICECGGEVCLRPCECGRGGLLSIWVVRVFMV